MTVGPLVEKELRWLRRNWRAVTLVFLLAPVCFGLATATFDRTLPRDVPVAVVPADDAVTEDELQAAAGLTRSVAAPRQFGSHEAARTALEREQVYGILSVEHGLYESGANVTLSFAVAGGMVTYVEPSQVVTATLRDRANVFPSTVTIRHESLDPERTLPEFLFATGLVYLLVGYGLTYVPYHVAREQRVFDRVRVESSLWSLLAAKGLLFAALGTLALASMSAVGLALGPSIGWLAEGDFGIEHEFDGVQYVGNLLEQDVHRHFVDTVRETGASTSLIPRVPHSSGLLNEQVTPDTELDAGDHRGFRPAEGYETGWEKIEELRFLEHAEHGSAERSSGDQPRDRDGARTMGQAAIQWLLSFDEVASVTPTFRSKDDIEEWAAAPETPRLSEDEQERVADLYETNFGIDRFDGMAHEDYRTSVDGDDLREAGLLAD